MNVEKLIESLSPGWALKRAKQRKALAYEAAVAGRLRGYNFRDSVPNDYSEARDRVEIVRQARDLRDNFGLFAAIIRKLSVYSLGRVRYRAHTGNAKLNTQLDTYIKQRSEFCDVSARYSLAELARMALSEALTAGDIFATYRQTPTGTAPQLIEADRVGGALTLPTTRDEFGGVKFDPDTGRVISYTVYDREPSGAFTNKREIPADKMRHILDPERYDRYRGISPFAPVINDMRDLKEVMAACLVGVKFNEYHAGFITGGSGVPNDPAGYFGPSSPMQSNGQPMTETKLSPGIMQYLPEGYAPHLLKSERPSNQFQSYLELLIRTIANALCLPYGFVYSLSGLGGPAARMDAAQAQRVIEYWQAVMDARFLTPTKNIWILDGVASGEIESPRGAKLFEGVWQFAPRITIDVGRESQAGVNEIRAGLRTRADWWDEEGKDADQEMEIICDESRAIIEKAKKLSEETGVPFERCLDMLDMRVPNGTPALAETPTVPATPPPDPESDEQPPAPEPSKDMNRLRVLLNTPHYEPSPGTEIDVAAALEASRKQTQRWLARERKIKYSADAD